MPQQVKNYTLTKRACYFTNIALSSVFSLPPLLFVTFKETYGISYTLLGTLVLINFFTQLGIDLVFTFLSRLFDKKKTLRIMPLITTLGLTVYAIVPTLSPSHAYLGLVIGTVIFSVAAGLCEVLLSSFVAAIPSETPDRDMSKLHSLYAYGVVTVVILSTLFLHFFGTRNWMYLTLFWAFLPIIAFALLCASPLPEMDMGHSKAAKSSKDKRIALALCVACIFFGSAAENSMTNWISGYTENALNIPKLWGDVLGLAVFGILLGLGRTLYAKRGKNISRVLLLGMAGAAVCYITAALSPIPAVSMIACVITGFCTSMLWPGTLILMEERIPLVGVAGYALMAAGGDFGGALAPQLLGAVVDKISASSFAAKISETTSLSTEQIGMKAGMLAAALFPAIGIFVVLCIKKHFAKNKDSALSE